jgi:D-sedoheptulose 7-phosphate isomerase
MALIHWLPEFAARRAVWGQLGSAERLTALAVVGECYATALAGGRTLFFAGNGGSQATAQHVAAEYVGRLRREPARPALCALALGTSPAVLTAAANDFSWERAFARELAGLGRAGDVLTVFTTSGTSPNLLALLLEAQRLGVRRVAFLGERDARHAGGIAEVVVTVPSPDGAVVQEVHLALQHLLCGDVERRLGLRPGRMEVV